MLCRNHVISPVLSETEGTEMSEAYEVRLRSK